MNDITCNVDSEEEEDPSSQSGANGTTKTNAEQIVQGSCAPAYHWRDTVPRRGGVWAFVKWFVLGLEGLTKNGKGPSHHHHHPKEEEKARSNLREAARLLALLRAYERRYGRSCLSSSTSDTAAEQQEWVLQELCQRLCSNGVPSWVLEPMMNLAARGLMGRSVDFYLRPRNAIMAFPNNDHSAPRFFRIQRSLTVLQLSKLERVLVRLASFATNTGTATTLSSEDECLRRLLFRILIRSLVS